MPHELNAFGQPVGLPVAGWTPPPWPPLDPMSGRFCRLEPLQLPLHAGDLHEANRRDSEGRNWTYLPYGPFETLEQYTSTMARRGCFARSTVLGDRRFADRQGRRRRRVSPDRSAFRID